jgi:hypothetical protein
VKLQRNRGADFNSVGEVGETFVPHLKAVDSEREALREQVALTVCFEVLPELVSLTNEFDGTLHWQTGLVRYMEAQFTCVALCKEGQSAQQRR